MCRYTRGNKRVDPEIFVHIRKEKAVFNNGKITNQESTIKCGRVDKNTYCFLLVNKLTGGGSNPILTFSFFFLFLPYICIVIC